MRPRRRRPLPARRGSALPGLSPRRRPGRHAQRDLDPADGRLRRPHRRRRSRRSRQPRGMPGRSTASMPSPIRFGCSQLGDDLDGTRALLARSGLPSQCRRRADRSGSAASPTSSTRCSPRSPEPCAAGSARSARRARGRDRGGPGAGRRAGRDRRARAARSRCRCRELVLGLKCGGSDGFSRPHRQSAGRPDARRGDRRRRQPRS